MSAPGRGKVLQLLAERAAKNAASAGSNGQPTEESQSEKTKSLDQSMSSCSLGDGGHDVSAEFSSTSADTYKKAAGRAVILQRLSSRQSYDEQHDDLPSSTKSDSGRATALSIAPSEVRPGAVSLDDGRHSSFGRGKGRAALLDLMQKKCAESKRFTSVVSEAPAIAVPQADSGDVSTPKETVGRNESSFYKTVQTSRGNAGTPIKLACNYIRLTSEPDKGIYIYEVRFNPSVDCKQMRIKYINEHRDKYGGVKLFDGVTMYLPILLKDKLTTYVSHNMADGSKIEIHICFKKKERSANCLQLYNILFDRIMKTLNYVRFDRKQYDPTAPKVLPISKLEIWPGYVIAVDEYDGGLMLCCDVSHKLLCQKTVLEVLHEVYASSPKNFQNEAKKALLGNVIITRYNNRTYRIDDICFDKSPMSTFPIKDEDTTYFDYYQKNYNITIGDKHQPLLVSIKKQKKYDTAVSEEVLFCLIPELSFLTGYSDDLRSDNKLMREIASITRVQPNQRMYALEKFYSNVNASEKAKQILTDWGLALNQSFESVQGRFFGEEKIIFGKKTLGAGPNADFSRHASSNEPLEVSNCMDWVLIHTKRDARVAKSFIDNAMKCSSYIGMRIQKPSIVVLDNDRSEAYVNALRTYIKASTQIVVCICPSNREDRYSAIKKICCCEVPVASQVINAPTLFNETKNRNIVMKIILQMNCKLGGSLWSVNIPFRNVMICGIDSYHHESHKSDSVSAFVASLNRTYSKWYSKAIIQTKKEEIVTGLCMAFISALVAYEKANSYYPDSVIIYRDGVGNGQLSVCEHFEIPQFEQACIELLGHPIKISFIVIQKRINTRYFIDDRKTMGNPMPGTVVDNTITRLGYYDFYLVSQHVRQGTVSPTHYVVLRDDSKYSPDILQRLSYKLCFMYFNWPGTIRIPACCQYAHKLAYMVGQNIRRAPADKMCDKLFYL